MKLVKLEVLPAQDGQTVKAVVKEQKRVGDKWQNTKQEPLVPGVSRVIMLEDDERVVVEGAAARKLIIDPLQSAVMEVNDPEFVSPQALTGSSPIVPKAECQTGVFRTAGVNTDRIRTGKPYRIYEGEET